MSKHGGGPLGALKISGTGLPGGTKVEVDGRDIAGDLAAVSLRLDTEHVPTATLDVIVWDLSTELDGVRFEIPEATRELLVRLGWTPPKEEVPHAAEA